ncbi:hypothetical protein [Microvirga sp. TS319]|uniref:hypothetical protein n=1 Tax=Microvirga sp. TS319 TaxID=3241165 RepID=UPI003519F08D
MKRMLLILCALLMSALLIPGDAEARGGRGGGGFGGGGARFGGGGFGGGFGGHRMYIPRGGFNRVSAVRPGGAGFRRTAINYRGNRFDNRIGGYGRYGRYPYYGRNYARYPYYRRYGRYPYYGRYAGRYPYYGNYYGNYYGGLGVGLVTGSLLGAAATYPYYNYPYQSSAGVGGYCATQVRTCALISPSTVGNGCSCRTPGGRARGTVVSR